MKRTIGFCCAICAFCLFRAVAEDEIVNATGIAGTYRGAINEALVSALERHDGITVSAAEVAKASESSDMTSENTNGILDDRKKLAIKDSISKGMAKVASGRVKSYDVISDRIENGKYRVEVAVRFASKYVVGLPEGSRRRMAVADFRSETGDTFRWYGQPESTAMWASSLSQKINERLTQTRKFTMLDRKFDAEVEGELKRLSSANASKADAVRLNQKLGTDYLVVGSVKFFTVAAPGTNPLTGQTLPTGSQPFCEVGYRVLLAATGQLKWSDSVRLDAAQFPAANIGVFASMTADAAAAQIADGMMSNILPFEVVGKNSSGEILIGEGGSSIGVGERLTVYALGEEVSDTRTGETLDQVEEAVGDVEVVRVSAKISYARVIGGDPAKMTVGSRLRRIKMAPVQMQPAAPVGTTVKGTASGGVVTPF